LIHLVKKGKQPLLGGVTREKMPKTEEVLGGPKTQQLLVGDVVTPMDGGERETGHFFYSRRGGVSLRCPKLLGGGCK